MIDYEDVRSWRARGQTMKLTYVNGCFFVALWIYCCSPTFPLSPLAWCPVSIHYVLFLLLSQTSSSSSSSNESFPLSRRGKSDSICTTDRWRLLFYTWGRSSYPPLHHGRPPINRYLLVDRPKVYFLNLSRRKTHERLPLWPSVSISVLCCASLESSSTIWFQRDVYRDRFSSVAANLCPFNLNVLPWGTMYLVAARLADWEELM